MALFNNFPYTDLNDINLDYTLQKLESLYTRGEQLYNSLTTWQQTTDAELEQWKATTEYTLSVWKTQTENSIDNKIQLLTAAINTAFTELRTQLEAHIAEIEVTAETAASNASSSAQQALNAASAASINNEQSKEWAIGETLEGDPVPSTNPAYENNAKYYADLLGREADQIATNAADITDLKSAIYEEYPYNIWAVGGISATDGACYDNADRRRVFFSYNSDFIRKIIVNDPNVTMQIFAWTAEGYVGTYKTNDSFEKTNTNIAWIKEWDLTKYPQYWFNFVLQSTTNVFDFSLIKVLTAKDRYTLSNVNGFYSYGGWTAGAVGGNAGDTASITTSTTIKARRKYLYIQGTDYVTRFQYAEGYMGYEKIVDENNVILYQASNFSNYAEIPPELQNPNYGVYIVLAKRDANANISVEEAAKATKFYTKPLVIEPVADCHYTGDKISLNEHGFNVYQGIVVPDVASHHKQALATYEDLLVQFYSDDVVKLLNIQTGEEINTFATTTGHGASAQFSTEFLNPDDPYPLLYISAEFDQNYIQVVHVTDETWEIVRTIPCPVISHVAVDNNANRLIIISYDTSSSPYKPTLRAYDLWEPLTVEGTVYTYPLVCEIPLQPMIVKQCILMHESKMFYLTSATTGSPHSTWLYVIDPYTGAVLNIIKDIPYYLGGTSSTTEVEGMGVYYDKKWKKNMMILTVGNVTQSYLLDFDPE